MLLSKLNPETPLQSERIYKHSGLFGLVCGSTLPELTIAYTTHGQLNAQKNNVVWVFHALTANSNPLEWWPEMVGEGKPIDTSKYFVVCANVLGSCYGTTGPNSISPVTGKPYGQEFPLITIRDMVAAHKLLQAHLGINKIHLGIGGSLGGQQLLEWAVDEPELFEIICPIATNAKHSAWGIAFNETQRMALEASGFSQEGLQTARAVAMLSYRHQKTYHKTQTDKEIKIDGFKSSSYQRYQGNKLSQRFDVHAYYYLSKAMDSHNIGHHHESVRKGLRKIKAKTLCIGIQTDLLFPVAEQKFITKNINQASLKVINSLYGHDGFLIETEKIGFHLKELLKKYEH